MLNGKYEVDFSKFKEKNGKLIYKTDNYTYEYNEELNKIIINDDMIYFINSKQFHITDKIIFDFQSGTCVYNNCEKYNTTLPVNSSIQL